MNNNILVTGACGFLGRHTAKHFKSLGYNIYAIGHGNWSKSEQIEWGIDHWLSAEITITNLEKINAPFETVIHCGGGGSVAYSIQEPMKDFQRSVQSTLAILEYLRVYNPEAKLIYPSSPAVQGIHDNTPIKEDDACNPVSPYGVHKKISEEICLSYRKHFRLNVSIIRFFSIYGEYLKKQLLWDASNKFFQNSEQSIFWGSGNETRDWIYIDDAVLLISTLSSLTDMPCVINGGSGYKSTIAKTLSLLQSALSLEGKIIFNEHTREGDPKYYWADIRKAKSIGWVPSVSLIDGIKKYAVWYKGQL